MNETTLRVEGMSCDGCVRNVSGVLSALDGVASAEVRLDNHCATVRYDPARINLAQLREAIEAAGFDAPED